MKFAAEAEPEPDIAAQVVAEGIQFHLKMMNFVLKMTNFVLKMTKFGRGC